MKQIKFKDESGVRHTIDTAGNYFVGTKCMNPLSYEGNIGDNYPEIPEYATSSGVHITGHIEL